MTKTLAAIALLQICFISSPFNYTVHADDAKPAAKADEKSVEKNVKDDDCDCKDCKKDKNDKKSHKTCKHCQMKDHMGKMHHHDAHENPDPADKKGDTKEAVKN